jgi:hypothetical protein
MDQWRSQPDNLVMLCKYFRVHTASKQSISKEMNNDYLNFAWHDQIVRLALPALLYMDRK